MPKYKLLYFNVRGRGEVTRMMFAAAGQEYEDVRISPYVEKDFTKLAKKEEDRERTKEWLALKAELPFGQVPVLEVDGERLFQRKAIETFLARKFGLLGKTEFDDIKTAMITQTLEDCFMTYVFEIMKTEEKEKQEKKTKEYASETLPYYLERLEKRVGDKGYFVADQLTYADITFHHLITIPPYIGVETDWEKYPKLKSVLENVAKHPGIAKWLKERPQDYY